MAFQKGQSGNPAGRPKGSRDKRTELRELLEPHAEELVLRAVNMALEGDITALKMCLDRLIPAYRSEEVAIEKFDAEDQKMYENDLQILEYYEDEIRLDERERIKREGFNIQ